MPNHMPGDSDEPDSWEETMPVEECIVGILGWTAQGGTCRDPDDIDVGDEGLRSRACAGPEGEPGRRLARAVTMAS